MARSSPINFHKHGAAEAIQGNAVGSRGDAGHVGTGAGESGRDVILPFFRGPHNL